jgi:CRISPR/Cas system-associated endonuclease/helicase Cas3
VNATFKCFKKNFLSTQSIHYSVANLVSAKKFQINYSISNKLSFKNATINFNLKCLFRNVLHSWNFLSFLQKILQLNLSILIFLAHLTVQCYANCIKN